MCLCKLYYLHNLSKTISAAIRNFNFWNLAGNATHWKADILVVVVGRIDDRTIQVKTICVVTMVLSRRPIPTVRVLIVHRTIARVAGKG